MGELNLDRLKPDRKGKILRDMEEINNMQCMISDPTTITMNSHTLLDVIETNSPELFRKCGTFNPNISDHHLIYGILLEKVYKHKPKTIISRCLNNINYEQLNRDLLEAPWHVSDIFTDIDDKYDFWNGLIESVLNEHAPIKKKLVQEKDIPYMTLEWKNAIHKKRKYAIIFSKNCTQQNFDFYDI